MCEGYSIYRGLDSDFVLVIYYSVSIYCGSMSVTYRGERAYIADVVSPDNDMS